MYQPSSHTSRVSRASPSGKISTPTATALPTTDFQGTSRGRRNSRATPCARGTSAPNRWLYTARALTSVYHAQFRLDGCSTARTKHSADRVTSSTRRL